VVFIGKRERGHPYCRPIAAHGEQGFAALPRCRVGWPVGVAGRAPLPRSLIMRVHGASGFGRARGTKELMKKEEEKKIKLATFPCCTSRGRTRRNSVA